MLMMSIWVIYKYKCWLALVIPFFLFWLSPSLPLWVCILFPIFSEYMHLLFIHLLYFKEFLKTDQSWMEPDVLFTAWDLPQMTHGHKEQLKHRPQRFLDTAKEMLQCAIPYQHHLESAQRVRLNRNTVATWNEIVELQKRALVRLVPLIGGKLVYDNWLGDLLTH